MCGDTLIYEASQNRQIIVSPDSRYIIDYDSIHFPGYMIGSQQGHYC